MIERIQAFLSDTYIFAARRTEFEPVSFIAQRGSARILLRFSFEAPALYFATFADYKLTQILSRMNNPDTPSNEDLDLRDDKIVRNKELPMAERLAALKRIDDRLGISDIADFGALTERDVNDYCDLFEAR